MVNILVTLIKPRQDLLSATEIKGRFENTILESNEQEGYRHHRGSRSYSYLRRCPLRGKYQTWS
jgi:hypothetical protein